MAMTFKGGKIKNEQKSSDAYVPGPFGVPTPSRGDVHAIRFSPAFTYTDKNGLFFYLKNNNSLYFGNVHISLSTISSSLSIW